MSPPLQAANAISQASVKPNMAIAAVVGDQAISSYDVESRIKFIVATAHISDSPDMLERVRPQVIRSLVDEKLESQEAAKNNITVTDKEVTDAIAAIENQRGMPAGTIDHMLEESRVPRETFTQQIRAQLLWNKLLMQKIRPLVHVSDEEIKLAEHRAPPPAPPKAKKRSIPHELNIAVIAMPVDKPSHEGDIRRLGDRLVRDMRHGASFEEVSRQFSSRTAAAGGKVETFWVRLEQLEPNIARVLSEAQNGTITDPIRTSEGFTIIKVFDTRSIETQEAEPSDKQVAIKEFLLKAKPSGNANMLDAMRKLAQDVAKSPGACESKTVGEGVNVGGADIEINYRKSLVSALPSAVKLIVQGLRVGEVSTPFASSEGIRLYMLCDEAEPGSRPLDRDQAYAMLMQQKMELEAQKYLRNLRRDAFVDIR